MTIDQLITLETISKAGSFKAAAELLHKTQPSLSAAIKKLEEEFQVSFFSRDEYRPKLTKEGRAFLNKAALALESFRELETFGRELSLGYETEINLSIDAVCPLKEISPILRNFFSPQVTTSLNLTIDILEGLIERILEHQVDFAIGSYIEPNEEHIHATKLFNVCMIPVVSKRYFEEFGASLHTLKKLPQIIVKSSSKKSGQNIIGALSGSKRWFTSDISMKSSLICEGLGWGRLPLHQVEELIRKGILVEVTNISPVEKIQVPIYLLKSKTKTLGPNAKNLWNYIIETTTKQ